MTVLLVVIFISFIGVGLPDSVLGAVWPVMYPDLEVPLSLAGYITSTVSLGTIVSSLLSSRLIRWLGTGKLTALSTLLTASALMGFALTDHAAFLFLLAIPLGLGAGAVDTALNSFVALHYSASKMNFLHCFYGLGVALSPLLVSLVLGDDGNWRRGYMVVAAIQGVIALIAFAALPLWKRAQKRDAAEEAAAGALLPLGRLLRHPGVVLSCMAFFFSCALELTAGSWSSSYFVNVRAVQPDTAARMAMLFYIGLAGGRFCSGLVAGKLGRRKTLFVSLGVLLAAIVLFVMPLPAAVGAGCLFFIGFGVGPIYPNLVHLTPTWFGQSMTEQVMGVQQTAAYLGIMVMPWLFGVLAQGVSAALLPLYLLVLFALYALAFCLIMRKMRPTQC